MHAINYVVSLGNFYASEVLDTGAAKSLASARKTEHAISFTLDHLPPLKVMYMYNNYG